MQNLTNDIEAIRHLVRAEARLRTAGRLLELHPETAALAARLFDWAERLRDERLDLLERAGLDARGEPRRRH